MLANGVGPDITSDRFNPLRLSQNMVVEAHGPELPVSAFLVLERRALFEDADKFQ